MITVCYRKITEVRQAGFSINKQSTVILYQFFGKAMLGNIYIYSLVTKQKYLFDPHISLLTV